MNSQTETILLSAVEKHIPLMKKAFDYIWANPETGYKEIKTSAFLEKEFTDLGYELKKPNDIPGFTAVFDTGRKGPGVVVFGELDALICPGNKGADPATGAVHACGHFCQTSALLGLAAALREPGVASQMCGKIYLCAVPAEELIELEYRENLKKKGVIKYFGGKTEFLRRGLLDGADLAFMVHTATSKTGKTNVVKINPGSNGCIVKTVVFKGKASHAGGAPQNGINALYAANLAFNAINALRETFEDKDSIRIHPIITRGGDSVNIIPDTVVMEAYVRGRTMSAINAVNKKVNRAISASAAAIGANVLIKDFSGYYPRYNNPALNDVFVCACENVATCEQTEAYGGGCSDLGDICAIMPATHPSITGAEGSGHGEDYEVTSFESAVVTSAKVQLKALEILLENGAQKANAVIADYKPDFPSKEKYFEFIDSIDMEKECVKYEGQSSVVLSF